MTTMVKIKAAGLASLLGAPLIAVAQAVLTGLTGNSAYPNPSVDLADLKAAIDGYTAALAAALDGGKTALLERDARRVALIRVLQNLASYVEHNCKDQMSTFTSSGFTARVAVSRAPQRMSPASILWLDSGANSGQMQVAVKPMPRQARPFELRYATLDPGGALGPWSTVTLLKAKPAAVVTGPSPRTNYGFQVRALGALCYTDRCGSMTRICI